MITFFFELFFFFNDTATTEIYTLSLHDALPISVEIEPISGEYCPFVVPTAGKAIDFEDPGGLILGSEEHTSEIQSQANLVCRLLLEKKKRNLPKLCLKHPTCARPLAIR